jgi:UDP-D-galactose:(glucosyl)LPS alpha-1,6-D-galactosyltransferase
LPNFAGVEDVASNGLNGFIYQQGSLDDMDSKLTKMFHTSFNPEKVRDSIEKFYYDQYFARLDIVLKTIQ